MAAGILAIWSVFALMLAASDVPWSNEAWAAIPALNLAQHGYMGNTVLASNGTWLAGIERHTYWMMPMHLLAQAGWYKLIGFSLMRQRLLSVLFGLVGLCAWLIISLRLSGNAATALLSVLIIGFERNFWNSAANGRMDMMAAGLGSAAIASYLLVAAKKPTKALLIGHSLAAAAILTHPCGVLFAVALAIVPFRTGTWRWTAANCAAIAVPYIAALTSWGGYIAQAPSDFHAQFFGNVSGFAGEYLQRDRFGGIAAPWKAIWLEVKLRYLDSFGFANLRNIPSLISAMWLTFAATAAAFAISCRDLRETRAVRVLGSCALAIFLTMALFEGMKFRHYLVYSLPFLGALAAIGWTGLWQKRPALRPLLFLALSAVLATQAAAIREHFQRNPLRTEFGSAANCLKTALTPSDYLIAPAEFGYSLGFESFLSDDVHLGFRTGLSPRFIVTSGWYRQWIRNSSRREPDAYRFAQHLLGQDYTPVKTVGDYIIYRKNAP
jgi:4-amino-4-deoxy-L-arabinose transferase-like glycosyltransferase